MQWLETFRNHVGGPAHTFVLSRNIVDDFLREESFMELRGVMANEKPFKDAFILATFNLAYGVQFLSPRMEAAFIALAIEDSELGKSIFQKERRNLSSACAWFTRLLRTDWENTRVKDYFKKNSVKIPENREVPFAIVILEYTETLVPQGAASSSEGGDRAMYVQLRSWARDPEINKRLNLIVLETDHLQSIAAELSTAANRFVSIPIGLPTRQEQEAFVTMVRRTLAHKDDDMPDEQFARLMTGVPHIVVRQVMEETRAQGKPLTLEVVFSCKKEFIEQQSQGLLKVKWIPYGFESLGALSYAVERVRNVAKKLAEGDIGGAPAGMMFIGPPGTGKTALAEALAHEAGIPFVELAESPLNSFVGESQKRWKITLDTLKANAPVIFWIDEFDKKFPNPDGIYHGDSGINLDIQGEFQNFLSDPNLPGRVYPLAATNCPERISPALIRTGRFDDKIAFLPITRENRPEVFRAVLRKQQILLKVNGGYELIIDVTDEDLKELSEMADFYIDPDMGLLPGPCPPDNAFVDRIALTGAHLEDVVKRAIYNMRDRHEDRLTGAHLKEVMRKTIPAHDMADYEAMAEEALAKINYEDFVPPEHRDLWRKVRAKRGSGGRSSSPPFGA